ncbi:glutamate--ammonia ligase [Stylonychia lemnae]|uniref:Glutamate--ammonia ligase n=1 Tax=Stylonychia lemnae TaxID=5949 RepID=A0A078B8A8_STYLE|nr:glutamate--ammonia ligase [Stylonychia lemnae]|eukprot:CDW89798.1 glutamate--ammonia ligase [Stylonychia lemnae]
MKDNNHDHNSSQLQHNKTKTQKDSLVLMCYQNFSGVRQAKLMSSEKYDLNDPDSHTKFSTCGLFLPCCKDIIAPGLKFLNAPRQLKMVPDAQSIRKSPFHPNHSLVFSKLQQPDGRPFVGCPRNQLYRAIDSLKEIGYYLKIGIEIEFYLLDSKTLKPTESNTESSLTSLVSLIDDFDQLNLIMKQNGINLEAAHKECGSSQYEAVLKYGDVVKTLDDYYLAKEIITQHFKKRGYVVTYLPKPFMEAPGNGAHVHMSLWKNGINVMSNVKNNHSLSAEGENFMAGILKYYDALLHFLTPSPNSLKRLQTQNYVGCYKVWGVENKEAPIRLISPLKPNQGCQQFEIKSFDNTANFYFAIASTIVCGLQGLKDELKLPQPENDDVHLLSIKERESLGIKMLPNDFEQRVSIIMSEQGQPLRHFFGDELILNILRVHQQDFEFFKDINHEDELRLLLERY